MVTGAACDVTAAGGAGSLAGKASAAAAAGRSCSDVWREAERDGPACWWRVSTLWTLAVSHVSGTQWDRQRPSPRPAGPGQPAASLRTALAPALPPRPLLVRRAAPAPSSS